MFKLIKFIFFIFSFFLIYCNQGADVDKIINHILYISDVTNGYYILEDDNHFIPPNVTKYQNNSEFIIAYQKVDSVDLDLFFDRYHIAVKPNQKKYESILKNKFNYWIFDIKRDSVLGPFSKIEYELKRLELKIPNNLQLKESS